MRIGRGQVLLEPRLHPQIAGVGEREARARPEVILVLLRRDLLELLQRRVALRLDVAEPPERRDADVGVDLVVARRLLDGCRGLTKR